MTSDNKVIVYDFGTHLTKADLIKYLILKGQLDSANLKPLVSVSPHKKAIIDMVIPTGEENIVMTMSQDNTVKITDVTSGKLLADIFLEDAPSCFCTVNYKIYSGFIGNDCVRWIRGWKDQKVQLPSECC